MPLTKFSTRLLSTWHFGIGQQPNSLRAGELSSFVFLFIIFVLLHLQNVKNALGKGILVENMDIIYLLIKMFF